MAGKRREDTEVDGGCHGLCPAVKSGHLASFAGHREAAGLHFGASDPFHGSQLCMIMKCAA